MYASNLLQLSVFTTCVQSGFTGGRNSGKTAPAYARTSELRATRRIQLEYIKKGRHQGGERGWWRVALSNEEEGRSTKDREKRSVYKCYERTQIKSPARDRHRNVHARDPTYRR
jgi:hypothetical protein